MKLRLQGFFWALNTIRCRTKLRNAISRPLYWVRGPKSFYSKKIAASCDTGMKNERDWQFDMLKKIGCRPQPKNYPSAIFVLFY